MYYTMNVCTFRFLKTLSTKNTSNVLNRRYHEDRVHGSSVQLITIDGTYLIRLKCKGWHTPLPTP